VKRAIAVGVLSLAALASPALAVDQPSPPHGGGVGDDNFWVGIIAPGSQGSPGSSGFISADDPSGPRPYKYVWIPAGLVGSPPQAPVCAVAFGVPGWPYALIVQDLNGAIVSQEQRCVPFDPARAPPAPPALPPIPTIGEIWRAALRQITPPGIGVNPRPQGLTGLETWLWYDGPTELQVSTSIGPWVITGTARISDVTFDMGDGHPVTAHRSGSEAEPAARYVYETKGTYRIQVSARWTASFVLSGPGLLGRSTPMGSAVLRSSREYPVQEVRSLLVPR
jgi:hypothetical protein